MFGQCLSILFSFFPFIEGSLDLSANADILSPALDISKPCLDVTRPGLDITKPGLDITKPGLDISKPNFEESLLEQGLGNLSLREDLDPFDPQIHARLLDLISIPVGKRHGYISLENQKMPCIRPHSNVLIGEFEFFCMESKGEGAYGKVFKAMRCNRYEYIFLKITKIL